MPRLNTLPSEAQRIVVGGFIRLLLAVVGMGWILFTPAMGAEASKGHLAFDHSHSLWGVVLKKHVAVEGPVSEVAYGRLKSGSDELNRYLEDLRKLTLEDFEKLSRDEQLACLINAYNAFTVKLILDHYPVESIKDIGGLFSSPWKKRFFTLLGQKRHLDDIEHGMIRQDKKAFKSLDDPLREALKKFENPRIHFALNCASIGCPALRGEAYIAQKLDAQLEDATRLFLQDKSRNVFIAEKKELRLSTIFKWYAEDFVKKSGSLQEFVASRMAGTPQEAETIRSVKKVSYLDYDWSLNGK